MEISTAVGSVRSTPDEEASDQLPPELAFTSNSDCKLTAVPLGSTQTGTLTSFPAFGKALTVTVSTEDFVVHGPFPEANTE